MGKNKGWQELTVEFAKDDWRRLVKAHNEELKKLKTKKSRKSILIDGIEYVPKKLAQKVEEV